MARSRIFRGFLATAQSVLKANGYYSVICRRRFLGISVLHSYASDCRLFPQPVLFSTSSLESKPLDGKNACSGIAMDEVKSILRLLNVEAVKKRLEEDGKEFISLQEFLGVCRSMGVSDSDEEATNFAKSLDAAGVVLIFRNRVYLHPHKVAENVMKAFPLALTPEDDPRRQELERLQREKEEIDKIAHRHVRVILWTGLCFLSLQTGIFFRLTFWELSWDVMEPVAFFGTTGGLLLGYMYFLFTSRDPTYQDLMTRLYHSKQRKLYKKRKFDVDKFLELQKVCTCSLDYKRGEQAIIGK